MDPGAAIIQYDCVNTANNYWTLWSPNSNGLYVVSSQSGLGLNVRGASFLNGAQIIQYNCDRVGATLWHRRDSAQIPGTFQLWNENSDKCLNVQGASTANGAPIIQYDCVTTLNNAWRLADYSRGTMSRRLIARLGAVLALLLIATLTVTTPSSAVSGPYHIVSVSSGKCANVQGASTQLGAPIIQYNCSLSFTNDDWYLNADQFGYFHISSRSSGQCMNVRGASTDPGAAIIQYTCIADAKNESWFPFHPIEGDPSYELVSANSGMCLNVPGASNDIGVALIQYNCVSAPNNRWNLVPA